MRDSRAFATPGELAPALDMGQVSIELEWIKELARDAAERSASRCEAMRRRATLYVELIERLAGDLSERAARLS